MRLSRLLLLVALVPAAATTSRAQGVLDVRATCDSNGTTSCQSTPRTVFRADDSGGILATGILGVGAIPATGAGERMMWHPFKAAFRAGSMGTGSTRWDDANVGYYSWAGGYNTTALGLSSFAVGYESAGYGSYSTGIGYRAKSDGTGAVSIGYRTTADADYAVAIGQRASANGHAGAFVISDASTTDSLEASLNNQFSSRYAGGYRLFTNASETTGVTLAAGGSSWNVVSDRNAKEHFAALDGEALLGRIAQLPLSTWNYIGEGAAVRHVGPMAQDWHRLVSAPLALNRDSLTINQGDFDGVNLAGILALEARTRAQADEIASLRAEVEALRAEAVALRQTRADDAARFAQIEATLARMTPAAGTTMTASLETPPRP